jgi:hypothetical protein
MWYEESEQPPRLNAQTTLRWKASPPPPVLPVTPAPVLIPAVMNLTTTNTLSCRALIARTRPRAYRGQCQHLVRCEDDGVRALFRRVILLHTSALLLIASIQAPRMLLRAKQVGNALTLYKTRRNARDYMEGAHEANYAPVWARSSSRTRRPPASSHRGIQSRHREYVRFSSCLLLFHTHSARVQRPRAGRNFGSLHRFACSAARASARSWSTRSLRA